MNPAYSTSRALLFWGHTQLDNGGDRLVALEGGRGMTDAGTEEVLLSGVAAPGQVDAAPVVPSFDFLAEVSQRSGEPISRCFQCQKCSAGCPAAFAMDLLPHQIVRHVLLGSRGRVLASKSIWLCTCCRTCKSRCPNGIDVGAINDALKGLAGREGLVADKRVAVFHEVFLDSVQRNGRLHELGMIGRYKLKTGTYSQDLSMGLQMFRRGKLKVLPEGIRRRAEVRGIFRLAKERD